MTCSLLEMVACCFRLVAIRVVLRGRAHLEWKVVVSGDQQSISDDQYFIDERSTIWGKGTCSPQLVNPLSVCPPFCNVSAKLVSLSLCRPKFHCPSRRVASCTDSSASILSFPVDMNSKRAEGTKKREKRVTSLLAGNQ